jgi:hypothetical protein
MLLILQVYWNALRQRLLSLQGGPDPSTPLHPVVSTSCQRVKDFLLHDPIGQAYAHQRGGVEKALQDFMVSGPGQPSTILFMMVFAAIMFGCVNSIREFVKETPIYLRERAVNLGIIPYMLSKIVVLYLLCMLQCFILVGAIAILDPYHQSIFLAPFLEMYISVVLASWAGLPARGQQLCTTLPGGQGLRSPMPGRGWK